MSTCTNGTALVFTFLCLPHITFCKAEAIIYHSTLASVKQFAAPYKPQYNVGYVSLEDDHFKHKDIRYFNKLKSEKVFQIEPSDAIDIAKYSQPALDHQNNPSGVKVPSISIFKARLPPVPTEYSKPPISQEQLSVSGDVPKRNTSKPMRDLRFIESSVEKSSLGGEHKFGEEKTKHHQSDMSYDEESYMRSIDKNNFTDTEANLFPVSSDAILSYKIPSVNDDIVKDASSIKISTEKIPDVPSHLPENPISTHLGIISSSISTLPEISTETAIVFNTHHFTILNHTDLFDNTDSTVTIPSIHDAANFSSNVPMLDTGKEKLSSGIVAGIVIAVLVSVTIVSSAVIYLLYKKYNGNCTSVVEGKFNSDNCGYLDDSLRSSIYLNNHIELPKESSEEMSSLDNDSFLNSLETMTIQNYWVDNSKNTKV